MNFMMFVNLIVLLLDFFFCDYNKIINGVRMRNIKDSVYNKNNDLCSGYLYGFLNFL